MKTFLTLFKIAFLGLLVILLWPFLAYIFLESTWLAILVCIIFGPLIIFYKESPKKGQTDFKTAAERRIPCVRPTFGDQPSALTREPSST